MAYLDKFSDEKGFFRGDPSYITSQVEQSPYYRGMMPNDITATTGIAPKQGTSYFHGLLGLINDRRLQGDLSGIADRYNEDYGEGASADDGNFSVSARDPQGNPYWEEAQEAMRERSNRPNNIFDLIKGFMQ